MKTSFALQHNVSQSGLPSGCSKLHPRRGGFTLIELLAVIAIFAVLAALILPVLSKMRLQAEVSESMARMRQIGTGMQLFANDNNMRLPGGGFSSPLIRWMHMVAPYMGIEADQVKDGVPYSSKGYHVSLNKLFTCPALEGKPIPGGTGTYIARYGMNSELGLNNSMLGVSLASVSNPAGTVLLATKANSAPGLRRQPYPQHQWGVAANFRPDRNPEVGVDAEGRMGPAGYLFCDGHVEIHDILLPPSAFYIND
jgi:prepilin-type N-terminal cleavage/methylation domain-containing protein/prepilin-type processing-associated H-X9-DG protein